VTESVGFNARWEGQAVASNGNPAYALRDILQAVMNSGANTVARGWASVLDANYGTEEFAQRHSEVVGLFNRVYERLRALPADVDGRAQYLACVPKWYDAVVYRAGPWNNSGNPALHLGDADAISQLTGLGAAFQIHSLTTPTVSDDAIRRLRESLDDWDSILEEANIDERLRNEIRASVERLRFLLDPQVLRRFGAEPVVQASKDLAGAGVAAMRRSKPGLATRIGVRLGVVLAVLGGAHEAVDDVNGLHDGVIEMAKTVSELIDPTKQIEPPKSHELPTATPDAGNQDIIDAETVEDPPPDAPPAAGNDG
jgi:hypothetical protein